MATSGLDSVQANALLSASVGKASLTAFGGTNGKLKLIASGANENTNGTEIATGGGYAAGGFTTGTSTSTWGSAAYSTGVSSITNSGAAITITNMPTVASITQAELWDTAGTPLRWWWGALTSTITTNSGDTLTFATSSITFQFNI
jgi:hypothetical protein